MIWFLILVFQNIELESVGLKEPLHYSLVTATGRIAGATRQQAFLWDSDGRRLLTLGKDTLGMDGLYSIYLDSSHVLVCGFEQVSSTIKPKTMVLNHDGRPLFISTEGKHNFRHFQWVNNALLGTPQNLNDLIYEQPFYFQAQSLEIDPETHQLQKTHHDFAKITQRQTQLIYNYRTIWVTRSDDIYYVANQLEAKIYIYDQKAVQQEQRDGPKEPTTVPSKDIQLKAFVPAPAEPFSINKPIHRSEYFKRRYDWYTSFSLIGWFSKHGDGYIVTYTVPKTEGFYLQKLDSQFHAIAGPHLIANNIIGRHDDQLYMLESKPEKNTITLLSH